MKVLAIGSDRSIFNSQSWSAGRQIGYGMHFGDLRIIVFSLESQQLTAYALSVETHVYPTSSTWRTLYGWSAFWIARKLPKPDVVTVQDPFETGLIGWVIARIRGAGFHAQVHTDLFSLEFSRGIVNRARILLAGFVLRRADRIRVVSERIKNGIQHRYAPQAPITVLPIFVDIERFKNARAGDIAGRFSKFELKFLVVARLELEKNVALAIESFAAAAPQNACLIILNEGSEKKRLQQLVSARGLSDRVFFEGRQDPASYYALTDLLLVPSHFEGYGLVIVEALAAGKPVLSTDVGVAKEAGAIVTSPEKFADALREWIASGPRIGVLRDYPYHSFDEYIDAYCTDVTATASK